MLHIICRLVNDEGKTTGEWEFEQMDLNEVIAFARTVAANRSRYDVRFTLDIAFPAREG